MAELTMANYTNKIIVDLPDGSAQLIDTIRVNGASELKAGYVYTHTGHTYPDAAKPDAADDIGSGICINEPNVDIDALFADDALIRGAMVGSGITCYGYVTANAGAIVKGTVLVADAATDNGYVIPGELGYEFIGYAAEDSPNDASNDRPILIRLG